MKCHKKIIGSDGKIEIVEKKQYDSLDSAIITAKKMNVRSTQRFKLIAYKCQGEDSCHKYHVGKSPDKKEITDKERKKWKLHLNI